MKGVMNSSEVLNKRKELRNSMTPAEATLWKSLKGKLLDGLKFRRQHSVGPYILDFYCPALKLAIELDGEPHVARKEYDDIRTNYLLQTAGIIVLRYENRTVFENPEQIFNEIKKFVNRKVR